MSSSRTRYAKALVGSALLLTIVFSIFRAGALPLVPSSSDLAKVDGWGLGFFVIGMLLHLLLRYGRCHFLLAPIATVPLRRVVVINAVAMAMITILPMRLGEMSRPALLRERGKLSAWAVTGTVGAERIIDGLAFAVLLLLGLAIAHPVDPLPDHIGTLPVPAALVPRAALIACVGFAGGFVTLVLFYVQRNAMRRLVASLIGIVSLPLAQRVTGIVERFSDGLRSLTEPRHAIPYLALTAVGIVVHVLAVRSLAVAVGLPEIGLAESSVVVGVLALGFAMPNAPGFFGQVQLAIFAGLAVYVAPAAVVGPGGTLAFLFYVTYVTLVLALALIGLVIGYGDSQGEPVVGPVVPGGALPGGGSNE